MKAMMRIGVGRLFLLGWLGLLPFFPVVSNASEEVVSLQVTPNLQQEPGIVQYKFKIPNHKDNVLFCVGWTSDDAAVVWRRSCQQLNGIYSPQLYQFEYQKLVEGTYQAFAIVYRAPNYVAGKAIANFIVLDNGVPDCSTPTKCNP